MDSSTRVSRVQELEELDSLAQATPHHLRTEDHLAYDRSDFRGAEIKPPVEGFQRVEDPVMAEARIVQRCDLNTLVVEELGMFVVEPAVFDGLFVKVRARIRCSQ